MAETINLVDNNLRFAGQYQDRESGLYYNYYRYYDPDTGRYITSDPIGLQGSINTYLYAEANPLKYTDPDGRLPVIAFVAVPAVGGLAQGIATAVQGGSFIDGALSGAATGAAATLAAVSGSGILAVGVAILTEAAIATSTAVDADPHFPSNFNNGLNSLLNPKQSEEYCP